MKHSFEGSDGIPALAYLAVSSDFLGMNGIVALLMAIFVGLSIVKLILDIRYHPLVKKRHEQAKRRANNPGSTESL